MEDHLKKYDPEIDNDEIRRTYAQKIEEIRNYNESKFCKKVKNWFTSSNKKERLNYFTIKCPKITHFLLKMNSIRKKKGLDQFLINEKKLDTSSNSFYNILVEDDENTFFKENPTINQNYSLSKFENSDALQMNFLTKGKNFNFNGENLFEDFSHLSKKNENINSLISEPPTFINGFDEQNIKLKENNNLLTSTKCLNNSIVNGTDQAQEGLKSFIKENKKSKSLKKQSKDLFKKEIIENIETANITYCQNNNFNFNNNDMIICYEMPQSIKNAKKNNGKVKRDIFLSESKIINSPELDTLTLSQDIIDSPERLFMMFSQTSDNKAFSSNDFLNECTSHVLGLPKWLQLNTYNSLDEWLCAFYESILIHQKEKSKHNCPFLNSKANIPSNFDIKEFQKEKADRFVFWKKLSTNEKEDIFASLNGKEIVNLCESFNIMLNKVHNKYSMKFQIFDYTSEQKVSEVLDSIKLIQILGPYFDPEHFFQFIFYFPLELTSSMLIFTCQKSFFLMGESYSEHSMNMIYTEEKSKFKDKDKDREKTFRQAEKSKFNSIKEIKEALEENIYTNMIRNFFSSNFNDDLKNLSIEFESILQKVQTNQNFNSSQEIQGTNQQIKNNVENEIENTDLVTNVDDTESISASIISNENQEKSVNIIENASKQITHPNNNLIKDEVVSSFFCPKSKKKSKKKKLISEVNELEIIAPIKIENKIKGKAKKQLLTLTGKSKSTMKKGSSKKSSQKEDFKNETPNKEQKEKQNKEIPELKVDKNLKNINQTSKQSIPSNLSLSTPLENSLNLTQPQKFHPSLTVYNSYEFQQYEMHDSQINRKTNHYKAKSSITYVKKVKKLDNDQFLGELNITKLENEGYRNIFPSLNSEEESKTLLNKERREIYSSKYQMIYPIYVCCLDPRLKQKINFEKQFVEQLEMDIEIFNEKNEKFTNDFKPFLNKIITIFQLLINSISEDLAKVTLTIYGSHSTGLALTTSDLDITIRNIEINSIDDLYVNMDLITKKFHELSIIKSVRPIKTASVPVLKIELDIQQMAKESNIKFDYIPDQNNLKIDLSFSFESKSVIEEYGGNLSAINALKCSKLISYFNENLKYFKAVILILKTLIYKNSLNNPYFGGLSSYGLSLMLVSFLNEHEINSTTECLVNFLYYYGSKFNPNLYGISPLKGRKIGYVPILHPCYENTDSLIILDPLNPCNNITKTCFRFQEIIPLFYKGYQYFEKASISKDSNLIINFLSQVHC